MKKDFKEVFDRSGASKFYFQHKDYKNITIPKDIFDDMTDEEVFNYVNSSLKDINKEINLIKPHKKEEKYLSPEEITSRFADLRKKLSMENFKQFFLRNSK
jgi:hypothetical protein